MNMLKNFFVEEAGQDGVEYALLIGFVSCVIAIGATVFTTAFDGFWTASGAVIDWATANAAKVK